MPAAYVGPTADDPGHAPPPRNPPAAVDDGSADGASVEAASVRRLVADARAGRGELVLLEGIHALKHAVRFGADIEVAATPDRTEVERLLRDLAPDVVLPGATVELDASSWAGLTTRPLPSPLVAVARRPGPSDATAVLAAAGRVVVLEQPRHLGNLGAVVRVAAAAGAGGVLVVGDADPWHPTAVRGAAGLQFALPVARADALPSTGRRLVALDDEGTPLAVRGVPDGVALTDEDVLLVGTERGGLSDELLRRADLRVAIPMRAGVASLNLATAVAVALYT
jgi:TrmH family RNA methyltransferase